MTAPVSGTLDVAVAEEFSSLLVGIHRGVRRRLRRAVGAPVLRGAQVELLRLVVDSPGSRVSDAAGELCLAGNSVSTLVNQLVGLGLLRREADPRDGRVVLLFATDEAVERVEAWRGRRRELMGELVADLPEEERAALAAALPALRRLAQGLREVPEAG
ncbi:MarR family winged helix-turn-helix transcriptional regulator [Streptomyces sp. FH025]|uniref:MarR family winged helix-turn-helix transcriptional regulator n=1 Tax=Streptomyces sp. FH025 TaxID=2815937 RepID=UPI001A9F0E9F|nr:MarR family transcriptional regulator [Streptomyces sp. FH025]MBO1419544.1 MarR family transcriptional regulator [Streptomyces sp. FH025]